MSRPRITAIVVHWRNEAELARQLEAWPEDPRLEILVVDNSASLGQIVGARILVPERNLGFGGAINRALEDVRSDWILILNSDVRPLAGTLEALIAGTERFGEAAGLVPALVDPDGGNQCRWQLQPLPTVWTLWLQACFLAGQRGPERPPAAGTLVEQPAAAALLLRGSVLRELGGFDPTFFPAWFEDVDLAKRLRQAGDTLVYLPSARFEHDQGGSIPALGYGAFLWLYDRHLCRYLTKHHGRPAAWVARGLLVLAAFLRWLILPLRRPRRARSRSEAAAGLWAVALGALSDFHRPKNLADRFGWPVDSTLIKEI